MSDNGMYKRLTPNNFFQYMFRCLQFSVGEFEKKCYESLEYAQPFHQIELNFVTDGKENSFEIPLSDFNVDVYDYMKENYINGDFSIYIGCRQSEEDAYIEVSDFEYNTDNIYKPTIILPSLYQHTLSCLTVRWTVWTATMPVWCGWRIMTVLLRGRYARNTAGAA